MMQDFCRVEIKVLKHCFSHLFDFIVTFSVGNKNVWIFVVIIVSKSNFSHSLYLVDENWQIIDDIITMKLITFSRRQF